MFYQDKFIDFEKQQSPKNAGFAAFKAYVLFIYYIANIIYYIPIMIKLFLLLLLTLF